MKEAGLEHWNSPNTGATNESGFTALPGGFRSVSAGYSSLGELGYFWSSTNYWSPLYRGLITNGSDIYRDDSYDNYGFSVRCIKD